MKVAVVIPARWDASSFSIDPTLLVDGFAALAHDPVICCEHESSYNTDHPVAELSADQMRDPATWAALGIELAIVFTWMTNSNDVLRGLREANVFVVSKGDTDGALVPRVHPSATLRRSFFDPSDRLETSRRTWFWIKRWLYLYRRELELIVANVETANLTVVETEPARSRIVQIVAYAGRADLAEKIECIGNPVPEGFDALPADARDRVVVSIGRWGDPQKNAPLLSRTLLAYGKRDPSARFVIVGRESEQIQGPRGRIETVGHVARDELAGLLTTAHVCLISSRSESFHIAGHEALASGCTVVGTPIPAVQSMVGGGAWGTVAAGRRRADLVQALTHEMCEWDEGRRDPLAIAAHWQEQLRPAAVARRYLELAGDTSEVRRSTLRDQPVE